MSDNVKIFFEKYDSDPELQKKVKSAEECYPGSLEIRESVVEYAVLPFAREMGLDFTVDELRKYEEKKWDDEHQDVETPEDAADSIPAAGTYWLLGRGWSNDEAKFCGG
jgi:hypothetical protein